VCTGPHQTLSVARTANSTLDAKTHELIALAVAVTVRCDGCIATHVEGARKSGATAEEITDALSVARGATATATLVGTSSYSTLFLL
jgi:AhpD family alkylhydroperoxidase